jgi:phage terminase large subunit-like protein
VKPPRDFKAFASRLVMDNGKRLRVQGFQADFIADVDAGIPECWLVIPEANGKTTLLAAFALYHVATVPFASVVVAASTRDQAMLLYRQAKGFVLRSGLEGFICQDGTRRIKFAAELEDGRKRSNVSESLIQIFAAEAGGADGVIPTLGIIDEPHRLKSMDLYLTWSGKLGKRAGQLVAISTAGEPGSEFEQIREQIRQSAKVVERGKGPGFGRFVGESVVLHEWAVPEDGDVDDLSLVKAANPLPSITKASLKRKREKPTMTLAHWRRFTCNMPTRSDLAAITEREWFAAEGEPIPDGAPVWAGLDVGWKYDPTAIVPLWVSDDDENDRRLGPATILEPPADGTGLDLYAVERALAELNDRHPIEAVVMDLSDARDVADWLELELGVNVLERTQGLKSQIEDYERFTEGLRNRWISHSGDRGLTVHALNAIARVLPSGKYVFGRPVASRMAKHQDMRRIDALVAAAMVHTARTATARSVYDTRGILAV